MVEDYRLKKNAAGRLVPTIVNGEKAIPYQGIGKYKPKGSKASPPITSCSDYPDDGNKVVKNLKTALEAAGIKNGMTISTHHHFRDGDYVANAVFNAASDLGIKDLRWFPSAAFPCHAPIIEHLKSGVVHHIEGSMNGSLGEFASKGGMRGIGVLRSHGGRYQAVQDGEVHIDIAVIAAPTADPFGNANGLYGKSACGLLGFALADSQYADKVIVVTDNLIDFPCYPWQIQGNYVDYVVRMKKIGDPLKIVSGTTMITRSPDRQRIARMAAQFLRDSEIMKEGFSFQAGAGGTSLAFVDYLSGYMREAGIKARFVRGGSTKYLVDMLEEGLIDYILDGQTFDLKGIQSMRDNPNHADTSPFTSYNYHGKGMFATIVDAAILGATEVDVNFNGNVNTHSDGLLLHGIGGWQNSIFSKCTIITVPTFRNRIPIIVDRVTTLTGPGELIDVVVTERGIAINPRRKDLLSAIKGSDLHIVPIEELKDEAEEICGGKPEPPKLGDRIIAVIKWVDGTVIDAVREVLD
jgi:citrate lyase subunit alpha/citrate CoA-transferase